MYFYLSLPVFSHWQGRLDPRAMILGRTRRGEMVERGDGRGRAHPDGGLRREETTMSLTDLRTVGKGTPDPMKVSSQQSYRAWTPQQSYHNTD